ncbi:hypothetical protein TNCV_1475281 [Trichonephila clavipes]|nr:hypothetical protein TNCV_1475281 [Trichonephila clavipes]
MERKELSSGEDPQMEEELENGGAEAESSAELGEGAQVELTTLTVDAENGSPVQSATRTGPRRNHFLLAPKREASRNNERQANNRDHFNIPFTIQTFRKASEMEPNVSDAPSPNCFNNFNPSPPSAIRIGFGFQGVALSRPNTIRRGSRLGPNKGNRKSNEKKK